VSAYLVAALAGLGAGAAIALLASGLVLTHLGSGVVNFAHGGIAAWAAYVYWDLFERGRYPLPFPGLPARIDIGARLTFASALVISLITAAVLGLVTYLLIFRLLRNASALAMVVATVGVLLVILSLIGIRFRDVGTPTVGPILPNENLGTGRYGLPQAGYWLAAIAVVVGAALWLVMRGTRFGLATLAAAESEKGAVLIGISPARQAAVAWLVSALLAGLTGVLFAPLVGQLSPILFVQYSVPALGAALLARFRSFPVAIAAGLVIGVIRSVIPELQRDWSWIPRAGAQEGLVFVAVIIAMVISGHRLPNRGAVITAMPPMPRVQMPARTVVLLAIAVGAVFTVLDDSWRLALLTTVIASVLALSLVVITGFVGQIALSQLAFAGIAAFSLARISSAWGLGFPWAPLLASLIATAAGVIVGIPALRVRGVNLAIVTLAGGVAVQEFVFKNREFVGDTSTGGATVANPSLFGYDLGLTRPGELFRLEFCLLATVVAALLALAVTNLRNCSRLPSRRSSPGSAAPCWRTDSRRCPTSRSARWRPSASLPTHSSVASPVCAVRSSPGSSHPTVSS
jgi:branched-chain amino acid transport system permease protein